VKLRAGVTTLVVLAGLSSSQAFGSGFYFGDNGATALVQGGAFTAQADDLSAMQYNPAGLAQKKGFGFLLDGQLLNHSVTFLRQDPGFDPANPSTLVNTVSNSGGAFLLPMAGISYGFAVGPRTITFALGAYGPPSVGRYQFPEPNYTERSASGALSPDPRRTSPQRYTLINNDILIYYPTLSVAFEVHPKFMVGASFQLVGSHFVFRQAMYSGLTNPNRQLDEDPNYDAVAKVDLTGRIGFTGVLGLLYRPLPWLSLGASVRPPVPVHASGTMELSLTDDLKSLATVNGNKADFDLTLPLEIRVGARFVPVEKLGVNVDFVYMGWQSVDAFLLTPKDVTITSGGVAKPVDPLRIPRNWRATYSARVGASYDLVKWVTLHAGAMYETGAARDKSFAIDFAHPERIFISGGVTGHFGPIDVVAGIAGTPTVTKNIVESDVRRAQNDTTVQAGVAGAGIYTSGGYNVTLGVRGHFGGAAP